MLCRDRTSRAELVSAHWTVLSLRRQTKGKRPTRYLHVAARLVMVHCWRTSRLSSWNELSHNSSHGANRHSYHAGKSTSIVRREARWHSLARGS
eukprot:2608718-Prymnesium_polylepis.1